MQNNGDKFCGAAIMLPRFGIKMVVCDLDGTLLKNDRTLSEYTIEVLNILRTRGIKFAIATARSVVGARVATDYIKPDLLIYNGGAAACGAARYNMGLKGELASDIIAKILSYGQTVITAECGDNFYYNDEYIAAQSPYISQLRECGHSLVHTDFANGVPALESALEPESGSVREPGRGHGSMDVHKVNAIMDMDIAKAIAKSFDDVDVLGYRGERWVRFGHKNAGKWAALKACALQMGIDTDCIAAFGDDYNDIDMLANVGLGVAMGVGLDAAKAAAKYVCGSNDDDAVAKWIDEHILRD